MSRRPMTRRGVSRRVPPRTRAPSGFTLIELMVALVLGLIVIAGVVSVFLANQQVYRTNQAIGDVQDGSRISFEMMARDIRGAGLSGCSNNGRVANVLNNSPTGGGTPAWWADWSNAVHGYTAGTVATDPALTVGTAAGNQVANTDSLELIGAAESGLSVASDSEPAANFKLNETTSTLQSGDIVIVCDPNHAVIVQISNYNNNNVTFVHNSGNTISPGNCSKGLGYPTVCTTNGNSYQFGPNSQIAKLAAVDWYIGHNPVGGFSLYREDVETYAGIPTAAAQEMVRGVTGMKIAYHQSGNTNFVTATSVTNWALVDAVQVTLTLQSTDQRAGTDVKPITRSFTATTTVRNRVN